MNSRVRQLIDAERLTPSKLADMLGVQRSNISHILSGRNNPGFEFIEKVLIKFPQISPDWFLLGKGSMYREAYSLTLFPIDDKNAKKENVQDKEPVNELQKENQNETSEIHSSAIKNVTDIPVNTKTVECVMIFYTDKTFETYLPSK
ncbi:MAG: helix-turn-helix transcriptional regulator [Prevotellaceae bacterium]|jgi:transcriptional regulator with XRE-family HTH domain|nr:helix-turn-helix transcriptional regulator [Prevotellaceae bacterium]